MIRILPALYRDRASIACLCDIHVVLSLSQAVGELCSHACGADGLYCEGGVPQLRAVVALHLHAILGHPQEIMQPGNVPAMVGSLIVMPSKCCEDARANM